MGWDGMARLDRGGEDNGVWMGFGCVDSAAIGVSASTVSYFGERLPRSTGRYRVSFEWEREGGARPARRSPGPGV
jgi:hypothetical protein